MATRFESSFGLRSACRSKLTKKHIEWYSNCRQNLKICNQKIKIFISSDEIRFVKKLRYNTLK